MRFASLNSWLVAATFFFIITAQTFWSAIHGDGAVYAQLMRQFTELGVFSKTLPIWYQTEIFAEHPYLFFYFSALFTKILGYSDLAIKIPNFVVAGLSVFLLYRLAVLRGGKQAGLLAGFILLLNGTYIMQVSQPSLDPFAQLISLLAVVTFIYFRKNFLAGLILGFAFLTKGLEMLPHLAALGCLAVFLNRASLKDIIKVSAVVLAGVVIPVAAWLVIDQLAWNGGWLSTYWDRQFTRRFFTKSNMESVFNWAYFDTVIKVYFFEIMIIGIGLMKSKQWVRRFDPLFIYFLLYAFFSVTAFILIKKDSSQHTTGLLLFGALFVGEYLWEFGNTVKWRVLAQLPKFLFVVALVYWGVYLVRFERNPDIYTRIKNRAEVFSNDYPIVVDDSVGDVYGFYHTAQWYYYPRRVFNLRDAILQPAGQQVYVLTGAPDGFAVEERIYQK